MLDLLSRLIISNIILVFFCFIASLNGDLDLLSKTKSLYISENKTELINSIVSFQF